MNNGKEMVCGTPSGGSMTTEVATGEKENQLMRLFGMVFALGVAVVAIKLARKPSGRP